MQLKVTGRKYETPDAVTLHFEKSSSFPDYLPGQYGVFRFQIAGNSYIRCYSFHSIPTDPVHSITIKSVRGGVVSGYVLTNPNPQVHLESVGGMFYAEPDPNAERHHVFYAAGSGITPVMAMMRAILQSEPGSTVSLVYSSRSAGRMIFREQLVLLHKQYPERFRLYVVLTGEATADAQIPVLYFGSVPKLVLKKHLHEILGSERRECRFYLCGPKGFMEKVSDVLASFRIPSANINQERFTTDSPDEIDNGDHDVTIQAMDATHRLHVLSGQVILEAALVQKLNLSYSCKAGQCGSCRMQLVKGKVKMKNNFALTDSEIREGQILMCQAYPTSDNVLIKPVVT